MRSMAPSPAVAIARGRAISARPEGATARATRSVLVDGHAHCYPCFGWERLLDSTAANFGRAADLLGLGAGWSACLLVAEVGEGDGFGRLRDGHDPAGRWDVGVTTEACSLSVSRDQIELTLIAGRQVCSAEGLEVLVLGDPAPRPDGEPLERVLEAARRAGAVAILPWGLGKWWGRRGRRVAGVLARARPGDVFVGDNTARPRGMPSRLLRLAERRGIPVLPGSDPLPLESEAAVVGTYGFVVEGELDPAAPWASLRRMLRAPVSRPRAFGQRRSWWGVARTQAAIRRRRANGGAP